MSEKQKFKHETDASNAGLIWKWFKERGGILIWGSADFSDPGKTSTSPAVGPDGKPPGRPHWWSTEEPILHITDPVEVGVIKVKELKRFHVGVRMGSQGMCMKVTDGGTRRIRSEVARRRRSTATHGTSLTTATRRTPSSWCRTAGSCRCRSTLK